MRGGYRPGSGRPKIENPRKMYSFRLNEEEAIKVKEFIKQLKTKKQLFNELKF